MGAESLALEEVGDLLGVVLDLLAQRQHSHLLRREPERQHAASMLDEYADEALERAEDRAMDHHGTFLGAGAVGVRQVETLGHVVIELNRLDLPLTLERVGHVNLDFGAVERALLRIYLERDLIALHRVCKLGLAHLPLLFAAEMVIGHGRELELDAIETERPINVADHPEIHRDFVCDLILAAKAVGVVL